MQRVDLRSRVVGAVTSDVREFEGRQVVWVDVDAGSRVGALTSESSGKIENASITARAKGFPLIVIMRSSGADIVEGFAALHGWGLAAKALTDCSGVVPIIMVVEGPAVSGPALLLGIADFVVMTVDSYAFVTGPTVSRISATAPSGTMSPSALRTFSCLTASASVRKRASACTFTCQVRPNRLKSFT